MKAPNIKGALTIFDRALSYAAFCQSTQEINRHRDRSFAEFSETDLLRESAWVILCSGFREQTVRGIFNHISLCFCDWESASAISSAGSICKSSASSLFGNHTKLGAILRTAEIIEEVGFAKFKASILKSPLTELRTIPFIGPVTVFHLAKNLGLDVSKPDRHVVKVSRLLGFESSQDFCASVADATGELCKVVDLVVWRYLADNPKALASAGLTDL